MCIGVKALAPGTGVVDSCELPSGYWELSSGPPEEQPVLLTVEFPLSPYLFMFWTRSCYVEADCPYPTASDHQVLGFRHGPPYLAWVYGLKAWKKDQNKMKELGIKKSSESCA